jgi:hypothetical protein
MRRRWYIPLSLVAAAVLLAVTAYPTEEKRIRKIIYSSRNAVRNKDIDALMENISYNFRGEGGGYLQIRKRAQLFFHTFNDLKLDVDIMGVDVKGETGDADLKVRLIASKDNDKRYLIGDETGPEDIRVSMEKSPHEWKVAAIQTRFRHPYETDPSVP